MTLQPEVLKRIRLSDIYLNRMVKNQHYVPRGLLIHAITAIFLNRALETAAESLMEDTIDTLQKAQLESAKAIQESVVRLKISQYYR